MKKMELTDHEVKALYYSIGQPHLVRRGHLKSALRRAAIKLDRELSRRRREAIYATGLRAGMAGGSAEPNFDGERLGSAESMSWWDGYAQGDPAFKHPMKRHRA